MAKKFKSDPENYYKMSEPLENVEKANEAMEAFFEELSELRKKYKLRDVYVVVNGSVKYENGDAGEFMVTSNFGSVLNALAMTAYAYGVEKSEHEERISKLLSKKSQ